MKQSNIAIIIFSVVAFVLFLAILTCCVFLVAYHVKNPDPKPSPETSATKTVSGDDPEPPSTPTPDQTGAPTGASTQPLTETATPLPSTVSHETEPPVIEAPYVLASTADAGLSYQDRITFLGDSTTYHLIVNKSLTGGLETRQVWYGAGFTLSLPFATTNDLFDHVGASPDEGKILADMAKEKKPEILVITLGAGISAEYTKDRFTKLYDAVVETVLENSPSTVVICNSIYPVCRTGSAIGNLNNPDIRKANGWILEIVKTHYESGKKVYYLDSFSALVDNEGYLPDAYSNGDGVHFNERGYQVILENLRKHRLPDV